MPTIVPPSKNPKRLEYLLKSESLLKQTTKPYSPLGGYYRTAMPLLWAVRVSLGNTPDGLALAKAHGLIKKVEKGYDPRAPRWREAMEEIDWVEAGLSPDPVPFLGPIIRGGKPLLHEAPTHKTSGLKGNPNRYHDGGSNYPAFDFGWAAGKQIVAPEPWEVYGQSSAMGADACYIRGLESKMKYWLGHIVRAPANGTRFARGESVAVIAAIPGADHGHLGIDARPLIGRDFVWGKLGHGPDYTYGSPTYGQQITKALAV